MRVLVVEDEKDVAEVFVDYLSERGHDPIIVRSAEAALGKLQTERPDAIILDIHLPGMSGLEFLKLRRIRETAVPIVAVSGLVTESQARDCLRAGAVAFVAKRVALERLTAVLQCLEPQALGRRLGEAVRDDRRSDPRAPLSVPVYVTEYGGPAWHATSVDVSAQGMKLRPRDPVKSGQAVRLTFTLSDGGPALTIMSVLTRQDAEGLTYFFVNATAGELQRLTSIVMKLRGIDVA